LNALGGVFRIFHKPRFVVRIGENLAHEEGEAAVVIDDQDSGWLRRLSHDASETDLLACTP
jgi:hypothetical protein